uniref:polcalcin Bet v 4-like n=1 Tax=Erigeron canadensis TaxID=72917 RepID=UPI001CB97C6D|nr:polcalcin Bet v 4-like [Erigeron canadensis]
MADEDKTERDRIFNTFDANGDGKISAEELGKSLKILGSVSPEEVQTMMDELDTDGDGYISYEEFTEFYNANRGLMKDLGKIF